MGLGLGSIVGGFLGYKGTGDTNTANKDIASARNAMEVAEAQKSRDFSMSESQKSRDFQAQQVLDKMAYDERMSSTAVSRRMEDMKKAGINPILAGKYDASSPAAAAGAGAVGATAKANAHGYTAQNKMQGMLDNLSTALSLRKQVAEINNIDASTGLSSVTTTGKQQDNQKKTFFGNIWNPVANDLIQFRKFADKFQDNAKDGVYIDAINKWLDNADSKMKDVMSIDKKSGGRGRNKDKRPWPKEYSPLKDWR